MAQLAANLPAAVGLGHPGNALDVKLPLSLRLREMKTGAERPLYFDCAGQVTVGELREATHRRFPVLLCRRKAKLFVMGQQLEDDQLHLFKVRGIYVPQLPVGALASKLEARPRLRRVRQRDFVGPV
ncbi:unnamed protein product [Effrenium voratum]|uniref:Uncharacterized protein n=1 Tax=Effrenium voratum TaxID=2562239 RepID=A0AA36J4K3_9DINO|nr:unnamed protein product [Effrenium voratum]CAJ1414731.1 unnamed protein product [Effrenium voratum]